MLSSSKYNNDLCLQEKADQRADAATFCKQHGLAHSPHSLPSTVPVFTVLLRLRQACIHASLLPPELQLPTTVTSDSREDEDVDGPAESSPAATKPAASVTEALGRMQGKHGQSTKLKRVLRVIKVITDLCLLDYRSCCLHQFWRMLTTIRS